MDLPNKANLSICSNQITERYNCLAFTFEMPFKDTLEMNGSGDLAMANPIEGWNVERSQQLGRDILNPILALLPSL